MNSDNLVGNILNGRYDVIEKIGTGGMATVYKAKDTLLNRFVAIKVLRDNLEEEEKIVSNFIKEAQSSASLIHNNIVSVYDVCEDEDVNYMVMELVDGITLKQYIREKGALPWQEACDYAIQIGQGIGEAHAQNVIHRDIKPQNIIMTKDKTLKVTDFGIARAVAQETTIVGGTALGSVHYISPEQARGGFTDARSDIYSLGIVLYEMLAGKVPFDGDSVVSVALMHLEKEPVNVKCVNMEIPADLAYVTMKAIAKEPSNRYQNVGEMLDDLHAVLADEPLPSKDEETLREERETKERKQITEKAIEEARDTEDIISDGDIEDNNSPKRGRRKKTVKKKSQAQKKADRIASVMAVATVLVIGLIVAGAYFIMSSSRHATVPDLTDMTVIEATARVQKAGFVVSDEMEYSISDDIKEGNVISQDPAAGKVFEKGSAIKLIVSIGASGGDIEVPAVENMKFDDAIQRILDAGLNYAVVEENSDDVPENTIIRQSPIAKTKLNPDDIVTLHVSMGKAAPQSTTAIESAKVTVPNVTGESRESAENILRENGLTLGAVTRKTSSTPEGTIISQSPEKGKTVTKGAVVNIVLSSGSEKQNNGEKKENTDNKENTDKSENKTQAAATEKPSGQSGNSAPSKDLDEETEASKPQAQSKTFTVKIPDAANDMVNIEIVANGRTIHNAMHSKEEGSVTVEITGNGTTSVQAYVDGSKVSDKTIEFN